MFSPNIVKTGSIVHHRKFKIFGEVINCNNNHTYNVKWDVVATGAPTTIYREDVWVVESRVYPVGSTIQSLVTGKLGVVMDAAQVTSTPYVAESLVQWNESYTKPVWIRNCILKLINKMKTANKLVYHRQLEMYGMITSRNPDYSYNIKWDNPNIEAPTKMYGDDIDLWSVDSRNYPVGSTVRCKITNETGKIVGDNTLCTITKPIESLVLWDNRTIPKWVNHTTLELITKGESMNYYTAGTRVRILSTNVLGTITQRSTDQRVIKAKPAKLKKRCVQRPAGLSYGIRLDTGEYGWYAPEQFTVVTHIVTHQRATPSQVEAIKQPVFAVYDGTNYRYVQLIQTSIDRYMKQINGTKSPDYQVEEIDVDGVKLLNDIQALRQANGKQSKEIAERFNKIAAIDRTMWAVSTEGNYRWLFVDRSDVLEK